VTPALSTAVCAVAVLLAVLVAVGGLGSPTPGVQAFGFVFAAVVTAGAVWVWRACRADVEPLAHIRKDNR